MPSEQNSTPANVRQSNKAFLDRSQSEVRPFAVAETLSAFKRLSPQLNVPDEKWLDTLQREATIAGFDVGCEADGTLQKMNRGLERWENEGGAMGQSAHQSRA